MLPGDLLGGPAGSMAHVSLLLGPPPLLGAPLAQGRFHSVHNDAKHPIERAATAPAASRSSGVRRRRQCRQRRRRRSCWQLGCGLGGQPSAPVSAATHISSAFGEQQQGRHGLLSLREAALPSCRPPCRNGLLHEDCQPVQCRCSPKVQENACGGCQGRGGDRSGHRA